MVAILGDWIDGPGRVSRSDAIFNLVDTAGLNGLYPKAYLRHVIARIVDASRQLRRRTLVMGRCQSPSHRHCLNPTGCL